MIEATVFNATLTTSIALWVSVIALRFVQSARFAGGWLAIAPAAIGVPVSW
jgi:hypothetical protein